ncbi:3-oxoacid CoA-transferase subunit A [Pseudogracilibacillus auburnensis]|uniref:3-oxoadipate CoA-transferase alpha subunit n=1 Tax=Pseudogracilibacillus auburnensis TaxID=1494959 RepID=A0A2V3W3Q9_9BACI|nr:3-oxoacid CoA-transferase subunit A [Pseudogracilibacillus auburnensis]MBO1001845.1 3-oxoacid CoA-transferase subunit A [Pseudogracilibacillus auburnensis]PXW83369.1 3-oxoadipate CoA-transferase alpha subunit [Pseudogracilibacillus auburnensis]
MINKRFTEIGEVMGDIQDGSSLLIGGQTDAGIPKKLLHYLLNMNVNNLTLITNHSGIGNDGIAQLIANKQVSKIICSFPRTNNSEIFKELYKVGKIELEVVPQGTLTERIRAGGAGIGGFYTKTGVGTLVEKGKEKKVINGEEYLLELGITADFALIKSYKADRWGNLIYRKAARNYNPTMAPAGKVTIVEVDEFIDGPLDPEHIITPGIYVDRMIHFEKGDMNNDSKEII